MLVKELRNILDEYDGEMEVTVVDDERNYYEFEGVTLDCRGREVTLALKYS